MIHIISLVDLVLLDDPLIYDSCHPDFNADFSITGEGAEYSWTEPGYVDEIAQNGDTYTFNFDYDYFIDTDTVYYNTITVENACNQVSETIEITHISLPFFSLDTDPSYCHEDEIFLVIHFNIPTTLEQLTISSDYAPIGNISLDQAPSDTLWFPAISAFVVDTVVIYTVAENACGQLSLVDTVLIYPPGFAMDLELNYTEPVCPGDTVFAEIIEYTGESAGIFFDFDEDYDLVPTGDNNYLIITDENLGAGFISINVGIASTCGFTLDEELVEIGPFTEPFWYNNPVCPGVQLQLWNQSNPINADFSWTMNGEEFSNQVLPPLYTTYFFEDEPVTLTATYPGFCEASYTDIVSMYDGIEADFSYSPATISVIDTEVSFSDLSDGSVDWDWDFIGLGGSDDPNPIYSFPDDTEGFYTVCLEVINAFGCTDDVCKDLWVQGEFQVYVPNAFTPDANGLNDVFLPQMRGFDENEYEFKIFDRWGDLIFETQNYQQPWIGNLNNGDYYVQNDVYIWVLTVRDLQGVRHEFTGHVSLVR
jgi:gliding motility-associated-like protein